jgi:hypothetical protein
MNQITNCVDASTQWLPIFCIYRIRVCLVMRDGIMRDGGMQTFL